MRKNVMFAAVVVLVAGLIAGSAWAANGKVKSTQCPNQNESCLTTVACGMNSAAEMRGGCGNGKGRGGCNGQGKCEQKRDGSGDGQGNNNRKRNGQGNGQGDGNGSGNGQGTCEQKKDGSCKG